MTYETLLMLWSICVVSATILGLTLIGRLTIGILRKNGDVVKSTLKYIFNILVCYLFSFFAYLTFALWVNGPRETTQEESLRLLEYQVTSTALEWAAIAGFWTGVLFIFNLVYQLKVERRSGIQSLMLLALADMGIMLTTIGVGAVTAYVGLADEIKRYF